MHHHNCFIIGSIARSLNDQVSNQFLVKCFSNSVDEIYFEFNHFAFRCNFYKGELFFNFDNDIVGENRLFKPQFKELVNYKAIGVVPHPYERSFHIEFDNGLRLAFKCFGRKANVLLFEKDTVINQFRKNIETDQDLIWTDMVRAIKPIYEEKAFLSLQNFNEIYPYFPAEFSGAIKTEADFKNTLLAYNSATDIKINEVPLSLSFDLKSQENNVLNAITNYTSVYLKTKIFSTTKAELVLKFSTQLKEKENYLKTNRSALEKLKAARKDEEIGNIILANLHAIPEGVKKIIVNDVYYNQPIEIKLDDKLNALKNADAYFKKDKAKPYILKQLELKVEQATKAIDTLVKQLSLAENAQQMRDLKSFVKHKTNEGGIVNLPYKPFTIEGYEVLVGKHAESNEKLLNYFSDKDDLWLHAKDVGGSHVIVKVKKNSPLPDSVLEKAASLAAYFSKSRQQDLATVAYTQRKFVRKIKGAEKGKVTVSQEKTILVKPEIPGQS
jgi:predicted ribosome quality control (RQC) complex YloA/Tae2 family protein